MERCAADGDGFGEVATGGVIAGAGAGVKSGARAGACTATDGGLYVGASFLLELAISQRTKKNAPAPSTHLIHSDPKESSPLLALDPGLAGDVAAVSGGCAARTFD